MAKPPYGDSSLDPKMPTYATGTLGLNNDVLDDCAKAPTGSTQLSGSVCRDSGPGTYNAEWDNGCNSYNVAPKKFPGLQT